MILIALFFYYRKIWAWRHPRLTVGGRVKHRNKPKHDRFLATNNDEVMK